MPYIYRRGLPVCSKPGIYALVNLKNGKVYVGSAIAIRGRLLYHRSFLRRGKHDNKYLQRSWFKYGEAAFRFEVLETCEAGDCIRLEQYWIDALQAADRSNGYNLCPVAGRAMQGRRHSEASRRKMSEDRKGIVPIAATEAAAIANRGRKRTAESVARSIVGITGLKRTQEQIANIKASHWSKGPNAAEIYERIAAKNRGKKHSEEHRRKISLGLKKHHST